MSLLSASMAATAPLQEIFAEGRKAAMDTMLNNIQAEQELRTMRNKNIDGLLSNAAPLAGMLGGGFGDMIGGIFGGGAPAPQMSSRFASPQAVQSTFGTPTLYGAMGNMQRYTQGQQAQMAANMAPPVHMGGPLNFASFI